jgi:streptogramin lyase
MQILRLRSRKTLAELLVALVAVAGLARSAGAVVVNEFQVPTAGSAPTSIVRGPDGNLWFTEFSADRIGRITPTGGVTEFVLAAGRGPLAITTGSDNLLYFTERLADRIGRLNPLAGSDAAIQASLVEFLVPGVGSGPHGIASGPDGALWFTEFGSDQIGRLTTAGVITNEFPVPGAGSGPAWITQGPDGALWFTEAGSSEIGRITTAGVVTNEFPLATSSDPEGITVGPDGNLWFASFGTDKVGRITPGGVITEFPLGLGTGPLGIGLGPDTALWSALAVSGRIARVTTAGFFTTFPVPTPLSQPNGITTGPDGALWFTELAGNQIGRIVRLNLLLTGAGAGGGPHVRVFDTADSIELFSFFAFAPAFTGGVRVAVGDVNGDGVPDIITGAGPGGGPHVVVFSGVDLSVIRSFFAYNPSFTGGVFVAAGDVNGDGFVDIIAGTDAGGGSIVRVFSGATGAELFPPFFAYDPAFLGGVHLAAGDVDGDGRADIITGAGPGGGPHVKVFSGANLALLYSFLAYPAAFTGGVRVGAGDVNGDGRADIVTGAGPGGGPHVQVFSGANLALLQSFFAYPPAFTGGVFVAK